MRPTFGQRSAVLELSVVETEELVLIEPEDDDEEDELYEGSGEV
jgi:hypothetical protein